jgi:hypothetical protein
VDTYMLDEMLAHLKERGVRFWPGFEVVEWADNTGVRLRSVQTAEETLIEKVDVLAATVGSTPVAPLAPLLRGRVPELYVIGDANTPQTVMQATYQGGHIGRLL